MFCFLHSALLCLSSVSQLKSYVLCWSHMAYIQAVFGPVPPPGLSNFDLKVVGPGQNIFDQTITASDDIQSLFGRGETPSKPLSVDRRHPMIFLTLGICHPISLQSVKTITLWLGMLYNLDKIWNAKYYE